MRLLTVAAFLLALPLLPSEARAQDMDAVLAAQIRRAETYPQGRDVYKEGKKDLKEAMKVLRKEGRKAYLEKLRDQLRD